jgi:predicted acetyltransferase
MDYLIITCKPDNIPSYRTCELLDGDLLEVKEVPQGHDLRRQGYTDVNIYRFDLD